MAAFWVSVGFLVAALFHANGETEQ